MKGSLNISVHLYAYENVCMVRTPEDNSFWCILNYDISCGFWEVQFSVRFFCKRVSASERLMYVQFTSCVFGVNSKSITLSQIPLQKWWSYHAFCPWRYSGKSFIFANMPSARFLCWDEFIFWKWLVGCSYNPEKSNIVKLLAGLSKNLALHFTQYNLRSHLHVLKAQKIHHILILFLLNLPTAFETRAFSRLGVLLEICCMFSEHLFLRTHLKGCFWKMIYRNYKSFLNERHKENLVLVPVKKSFNINTFKIFLGISVNALNQHVHCEKKTLPSNHSTFINKKLSKAIMTRTRLTNFWKIEQEKNRRLCTRMRNYCLSLSRKAKREFYGSINERMLLATKLFGSLRKYERKCWLVCWFPTFFL